MQPTAQLAAARLEGGPRGIPVRREPERDEDGRAEDRPDRHPHDGDGREGRHRRALRPLVQEPCGEGVRPLLRRLRLDRPVRPRSGRRLARARGESRRDRDRARRLREADRAGLERRVLDGDARPLGRPRRRPVQEVRDSGHVALRRRPSRGQARDHDPQGGQRRLQARLALGSRDRASRSSATWRSCAPSWAGTLRLRPRAACPAEVEPAGAPARLARLAGEAAAAPASRPRSLPGAGQDRRRLRRDHRGRREGVPAVRRSRAGRDRRPAHLAGARRRGREGCPSPARRRCSRPSPAGRD